MIASRPFTLRWFVLSGGRLSLRQGYRSSDPPVVQVFVELQGCLMPEGDVNVFGRLLELRTDHLRDLV